MHGTSPPYFNSTHAQQTIASATETIPTLPNLAEPAHNAIYRRFVDTIRGTGSVVASGDDGLAILRLLEATYRSAAEKREITL